VAPVTTPSADAAKRRREILEAALELLAEHGYAGASLRKVAAKIGIAQPSLYHYFASKEELVEQVLATFAGDMFVAMDVEQLPRKLRDVPRFIVDTVRRVYESPTHPQFVRVAFSVSRSHPRFGVLMRRIFVDQATLGMKLLMKPFVERGEIGESEAVDLLRALINAAGLHMMEHKVLFDERPLGPEADRFTNYVIELGETYLRSLARRRT
jgi:AcrR family transcriptional regulator